MSRVEFFGLGASSVSFSFGLATHFLKTDPQSPTQVTTCVTSIFDELGRFSQSILKIDNMIKTGQKIDISEVFELINPTTTQPMRAQTVSQKLVQTYGLEFLDKLFFDPEIKKQATPFVEEICKTFLIEDGKWKTNIEYKCFAAAAIITVVALTPRFFRFLNENIFKSSLLPGNSEKIAEELLASWKKAKIARAAKDKAKERVQNEPAPKPTAEEKAQAEERLRENERQEQELLKETKRLEQEQRLEREWQSRKSWVQDGAPL